MRTARTTGDKGLDREIDALWAAISQLQPAPTQSTSTPSPVASPGLSLSSEAPEDVAAAAAAGDGFLAADAGHVHKLGIVTTKGDLLVYGTAPDRLGVGTDGYVLAADAAQALGLVWAAIWAAARVNGSNLTLTASRSTGQAIVVDDSTGRTVTLPDPAVQKAPVWIRALTGDGHTLARYGSENIDGAGADLTMGASTAGQTREIVLVAISGNWYSLHKAVN